MPAAGREAFESPDFHWNRGANRLAIPGLLLLACVGPVLSQSFTIDSPTASQVVSGFSGFSFAGHSTSAPSGHCVVWSVGAYAVSPCVLAPYTYAYNSYLNWNGDEQVGATLYDTLGNIVATAMPVTMSTQNPWPVLCTPHLTVTTGISLTSSWSTSVNVTGTVSGCSGDSLRYQVWVDGVAPPSLFASSTSGSATIAVPTTGWKNGQHVIAMTVTDGTNGTSYSNGQTINNAGEWSALVTFSNSATPYALQVNAYETFLTSIGATKTITANFVNRDSTTSTPSSLLFYSQNPSVATVNQTTGVVTTVSNGAAEVRAMAPTQSGTDLQCVGNCSNHTYNSASHTFTAADDGNVMEIRAGTGWTPGFYEMDVLPGGGVSLSSCTNGTTPPGACSGPGPGGTIGDPGTWTFGPSRSTWVFVNNQNILAHFCDNGTIVISYNPSCSFVLHSIFMSDLGLTDVPYSPGFVPDIAASGYNAIEVAITSQTVLNSSTSSALQNAQTSYVTSQLTYLNGYPNLHFVLIGDILTRTADELFATVDGTISTFSPPGVTSIFQSWTGLTSNAPIEAPMQDEVNLNWPYKPLQSPITFTAGSTQSGLTSIVASSGTCTVNWTAPSLNSSNNFIIHGSVTSGMNNAAGATYTASNKTSSGFNFSCPRVANGTCNSSNDSLLTIEPYGTNWFNSNTAYIPYTAFASVRSWATAVTGYTAMTYPVLSGSSLQTVANWEGNQTGPFGSNQTLLGVTDMSDSADIYWSNLNSYLARRVTAQSISNSNVGPAQAVRTRYGAFDPGKPIVLETPGTPTNYGFQGYTCSVASIVNGLITFSSATSSSGAPCAPRNVIAGLTRLTLAGSSNSSLNTNYYIWNCPTSTTCNVYYAVTTFTGSGSGCTLTFQNGDTLTRVSISSIATNGPNGVIGGIIYGPNWSYGTFNSSVPRHIGQTFTLNCTGGTAHSTFNSTTFLYPADNVVNYNLQTFRQLVTGSATGGTATIIADALHVKGRNADLGYDYNPDAMFASVIDAMILGAAGQRAYFYAQSPQAWSNTTGFNGPSGTPGPTIFGDMSNQTFQAGLGLHYENDLAVPTFRANSMAARLWSRIAKYILQPRSDTPDYGWQVETTARSGSYGNVLVALNVTDSPQTQTFTLTPYLQSGQQIVRFYATYNSIQLTTLAAGISTDAPTLDPEGVVVYLFPVNYATELEQPVISVRLADIPNATQVVVQYSYDPYWLDSNGNTNFRPIPSVNCRTGPCALPVDRNIGPVFYRVIYLGSNSNVLATSGIQTL
jgi:hypothetical protein